MIFMDDIPISIGFVSLDQMSIQVTIPLWLLILLIGALAYEFIMLYASVGIIRKYNRGELK